MPTLSLRKAPPVAAIAAVHALSPGPAPAAADKADTPPTDESQKVLERRLEELERKLEQTERELAEAKAAGLAANERAEQAAERLDSVTLEPAEVTLGNLALGGAMRTNYTAGDYTETPGASPAFGDGGNFSLDTFRINLDYRNGPYTGKLEYRWYDGYHFLHTGWAGYRFKNESEIRFGVNRVPFGPGPYGVSQSWFFDQHYYLGLADDMDLGVKYRMPLGRWTLDVAYYDGDEGDYRGRSRDSARYSYDVVNETGEGYRERNQINVRAVYALPFEGVDSKLGFSLQDGRLESRGAHGDGRHRAASLHAVNKWGRFTLAGQLTYYDIDVDADQPLGTDALVQLGAYDFPNTVAARAWIPALSLSYYQATKAGGWFDYVIPYVEYSAVEKTERSFNDSEMFVLGSAWGRGGWYIYTDLALSNGNEFVGGQTPSGDRLGANADDDWLTRFNINFGFYF